MKRFIISMLMEGNKVSNMRVTIFVFTCVFILLSLTIVARMIIFTYKGVDIDYQGIAYLLSSYALILGAGGISKAMQKGKEVKKDIAMNGK